MPAVYPVYSPGGGSGAMDALRKLGSLDPTDAGGRIGVNPNRLAENDNWGAYPGQAATPTPRLPLSQTPPLEDDSGPLAGLYNAVPGYRNKTVQQYPQSRVSWAGERDAGY